MNLKARPSRVACRFGRVRKRHCVDSIILTFSLLLVLGLPLQGYALDMCLTGTRRYQCNLRGSNVDPGALIYYTRDG